MLKQSDSTEKAEVQAKVEEEMKKVRSMLNLDFDLTLFCAAFLLECSPVVPHVGTIEVLAR